MVESELIKLYNDTKKKLADLVEDLTFSNFLHALQSGKRVYTLKNTKIKKTIDEEWVEAIKACIPHLDAIVNNPRKYMKREQDVVPVEKARIVNADSVKHLAAHTNLINSVADGEVRPNKILTSYNEESLELYENRFVMTLITRLWQFVDRRYFLLGEGGDEFMSTLDVDGGFVNAGEDVDYSLNMRVHQGAEYFESGYSDKLYEDLYLVRKYTNSFRYSPFSKVMSSYAAVRPPIMKTNLLMKDPHYRACLKLWDFLQGYTKAGYKIEVTDYAPDFERTVIDEFDAINLLQYVFLKNRMAGYDDRVCRMKQCKKRVIKPDFGDIEPTDEEGLHIKEKRGMTFGLGDSGKREFESVIRDAMIKALRVEKTKKRLADEEERELNRIVKETLVNSMREQKEERKRNRERYETAMRSILSDILDREKRENEKSAEAERELESALSRAIKRDLNAERTRTRRELERKRREEAEREELMNAVLNDVLKLEAQRKFPNAHPGVVLGSQNLPVPDERVSGGLPVPRSLYDMFDDMFVPPPPSEAEIDVLIEEAKAEAAAGVRAEDVLDAEMLEDRPELTEEQTVAALRQFAAAQRDKHAAAASDTEAEEAARARKESGALSESDVFSDESGLGPREEAQDAEETEQARKESGALSESDVFSDESGTGPREEAAHASAPAEPERLGFWRTLVRILFFWWKR